MVSSSTGYVERLHKVFKNSTTKLCNGLGYARALSLAFINARMVEETRESRPTLERWDWTFLMQVCAISLDNY